ncbi:MAG: hypothetical protein HQK51_00040 [Oligoflexia bacterium]|nr:hypothetical protein [Oligoflexia bacterium]
MFDCIYAKKNIFLINFISTVFTVFIASTAFTAFASSDIYLCNINLIQPKQEVALENISQYVERFSFENKGEGAGVKSKFRDIEMYIWNQKNNLHLIVKDLKRKIDIQTSFPADQDDLFLRLSPEPETKVQCMSIKKWESLEDESVKVFFQVPPLSDNSNLLNYTTNVQIVINRDILFKYHSSRGTGAGSERNEELFFQSGKVLNGGVDKDNNKEWCMFRIQRKMDEDTTVPLGTKIPVVTVTSNAASKEHYVLNYNFVDFVAGKKNFETYDFIPFVLQCKIRNGVILTKKFFKDITGNYFDVVSIPGKGSGQKK